MCSCTFLRFLWSLMYAAAAAGLALKSTSRSLTTSGKNSNSDPDMTSDDSDTTASHGVLPTVWLLELVPLRSTNKRKFLAVDKIQISSVRTKDGFG